MTYCDRFQVILIFEANCLYVYVAFSEHLVLKILVKYPIWMNLF